MVVKALGVYIDNKFTFNQHVKQCCAKAARQLNAFSRISKFLNCNTKKIIFNSFIKSNFEYCPTVWHFCGKRNNSKIEKIQERALKIVFGDYDSDYQDLIQRFGTTTLLRARINKIITEIFKSIHHMNPTYLHSLFKIKKQPYNMRDEYILVQPKKSKTNFGLRSVSYFGSHIWNDLPTHIKQASGLQEFKTALKNWRGPNFEICENFYV